MNPICIWKSFKRKVQRWMRRWICFRGTRDGIDFEIYAKFQLSQEMCKTIINIAYENLPTRHPRSNLDRKIYHYLVKECGINLKKVKIYSKDYGMLWGVQLYDD